MKKILYLHAGAELYGADNILLEILNEIDKTEFQPFVILPCDGPLVEKIKELGIYIDILPYPILRRKYFNPKGIISYVYNYYKYNKKILNFVKQNNIDIIHLNTIAVLQGIYLKNKVKCKIIYHIHEMINSPKIVFKFVYSIVCKSAHKVVVVSEAVKDHIKAITGNNYPNIEVIHNGIDIEKYTKAEEYIYNDFNIPVDSKVIGMVGRINDTKGQDHFVKAIAPIIKKNNSVYGIMIGGTFEGQEWRKDELQKLIDSYGPNISNNFKIIDFTTEISKFYKLFDLYVLPSVKYDSFPTVVLEAMASSLPIVAYKQGGVCEMVQHNLNGYLIEWKNIELLSKTIENLISNEKNLNLMSKKSIDIMKNEFSIDKFICEFEKLYKRI